MRLMKAGIAVLIAGAIASAGLVAGVLVATPPDDDSWAQQSEHWIDTGLVEYRDERALQASVTIPDQSALILNATGILTHSECVVGATLSSGQITAHVEEQPILGLATSVPLWRGLTVGDQGEDVKALQRELTRLGFEVSDDGRYGGQTRDALSMLWKQHGITDRGRSLDFTQVMWLPETAVVVFTCDVHRGQSVGGNQEFAHLTQNPVALTVGSVPEGTIDGARQVTINGVSAELDDHATTDDSALLDEVQGTDAYKVSLLTPADGALQIPVNYELVSPLDVLPVPPASLGGGGGQYCIETPHGQVPVSIVASQLGQTFVAPMEGSPTFELTGGIQVKVPPPGGRIECSQ